ncbi:hypothetical protein CBF30_04200 [Vagococcus entomophilus]|uniref:Uncharacterized protein n=2 Tax=Vagococcus entomophilus TaxID=1160095 RepID=A0A430AK50_9ENTE|nr:hypothetical protein CBF30_04200 [Vagococcus entomophilus]
MRDDYDCLMCLACGDGELDENLRCDECGKQYTQKEYGKAFEEECEREVDFYKKTNPELFK